MMMDIIGAGALIAYYLVAVILVPMLVKHFSTIPNEYIRKVQHIAYGLSIFILLHLFSQWYMAAGAAFLLVVFGFPALVLIEKTSFFKQSFVGRVKEKSELRRQLLFVQLSFAILIFVFWGLLGPNWKYVAVGAVMVWAFGDAAAALVGKFLGRITFFHPLIEKAKTFEGTAAMSIASGLILFLVLLLYARLPWLPSLLIATIVGPACAIVELFSKRGLDTLTIPFTAAALLFALVHLFGLFWGF